jgi:pyruvate dehydrogenase E2 component (dihydrolipoamide acetyltransferase)
MEEGVVVKWLKREGDRVVSGEALAEIETDKAVLELEATASGVLQRILALEESKVTVGQPLALIGAEGEDASSLIDHSAAPAPMPISAFPPSTPPPSLAVAGTETTTRLEPITRERIDASPLARRMAEAARLDIAQVPGSGPGGRVVKRDIEAFLEQSHSPPAQSSAPGVGTPAAARDENPQMLAQQVPLGVVEVGPSERDLSLMRRAIARRMVLSKTTAPHFYLTTEIDMAHAIKLRHSLNELAPDEAKISFNDMILKAVANALRQFPQMNVSFADDKVRAHQRIHLGMAVALDDGLITPVIRDCDRKSLGEIAREAKELSERARARRLKPEDYTAGTFTVSNLGMFEIEEFAAIINPPEAAILAVGAIKQQPVVVDGELGIGPRMKVTLSGDHRVVDGAMGARFLQIVKRLLEQPLTLML